MKTIYILLMCLLTVAANAQNDTLLTEKIVPIEINITVENLKPITNYYYSSRPFTYTAIYHWPNVNNYTSVRHAADLTLYNLNVENILFQIFIDIAHAGGNLNTTLKVQTLKGLRYSYIGCKPRPYITCEDLGYELTTSEIIYEKVILDILGSEFTNEAVISKVIKNN